MITDYFYMMNKPEIVISTLFLEFIFITMWALKYVWSVKQLLTLGLFCGILINFIGLVRKC